MIWLPSPYAVSMGNDDKLWGSSEARDAIVEEFGDEQGPLLDEFKFAYASAAIRASGNRQFHMVHEDYSDEVQKILKAIAVRVAKLAKLCAKAKSKEDPSKCLPPTSLPARLDILSKNLFRFLGGGGAKVWRAPLFTDALSEKYAKKHLSKTKKKGTVERVV